MYNFLTMLCINVHAEPPLFCFFPNRPRPSSLFSPLNSSADRVDAPLQSYHKAYSHQQVFAQQQGTTVDCRQCQTNRFSFAVSGHSLTSALPLLFAKDVCMAKGRCFNRRATEASRQPVTSQTPLPHTLQVRAACVAVSLTWGWLQAPEESSWLMMKIADLSD